MSIHERCAVYVALMILLLSWDEDARLPEIALRSLACAGLALATLAALQESAP